MKSHWLFSSRAVTVSYTHLDVYKRQITGVVTGDRVFSRMETELKALQATTQAAGKTTVERREREVKHWQWAVALMAKLVDAALELRTQEIGWQMKGLMLSLIHI